MSKLILDVALAVVQFAERPGASQDMVKGVDGVDGEERKVKFVMGVLVGWDSQPWMGGQRAARVWEEARTDPRRRVDWGLIFRWEKVDARVFLYFFQYTVVKNQRFGG